MEARLLRLALGAAIAVSLGASYRTQNFIVTAPTGQLAKQVAEAAETYRRDLAVEWLGQELPPWSDPCPITVQAGEHMGAGGVTSFMFDRGRPYGWRMSVQGSQQRILDSVLPHEITHTIFATHFGRPLPRWADEGACTTVEHESERKKQEQWLVTFLTTGRGIAFNRMFAMKEYPADILPLYSQGYSLARFLIAQGGKRKFIRYVGDGMDRDDWAAVTRKHYGFEDLSDLQVTWLEWVKQGSPAISSSVPALAQQDPAGRDDSTALVSASTELEEPRPAAPEQRIAAAEPSNSSTSGSSTSGSWYLRVRDQSRGPAGSSEQPTASGDRSTELSPATRPSPATQAVTRPQPIGRPRQTVLEWSRSPRHGPARSTPLQRAPSRPSGSAHAAPAPSGSLGR